MKNYRHEKLNERIIRIVDDTETACYLVIGEKKACLLDTCNGLGNIREYVETLTNKPIFVILTHGHHDHIGGANLFDEIGTIEERLTFLQRQLPNDKVTEKDIQPLVNLEIIKPVQNDQIFDLGNLHIQMISVKGHTPGMMCPLIIEERSIIFGDACGVCVMLLDEYSSCVSEYKESLLNLKKYESRYDYIYRNHGTFWSPKELLDNVIECCDLILNKQDDHYPIELHQFNMFAAKKIENGSRIDGKQGNLCYIEEKAH